MAHPLSTIQRTVGADRRVLRAGTAYCRNLNQGAGSGKLALKALAEEACMEVVIQLLEAGSKAAQTIYDKTPSKGGGFVMNLPLCSR